MTLLTVVAAGIAVVAVSEGGRTLGAVTDRSIPAVTATLRLAVNSANVAATAPGLISARTEDGRIAVKAQLQSSLAAIDMELAKIAETDADAASELRGLSTGLAERLVSLEAAVAEREAAGQRLAESRRNVLKLHESFLQALLPQVEEANSTLIISGGETVDDAGATIERLVAEDGERRRKDQDQHGRAKVWTPVTKEQHE